MTVLPPDYIKRWLDRAKELKEIEEKEIEEKELKEKEKEKD